MLQLARIADREAVEIIAKQAHRLHVSWRPDIYNMPDAIFPDDRFAEGIASKELYVAKICNQVLGYVRIHVRTYDWPGVVKRRVMFLDEIAVREDRRKCGIGTQMIHEVKALGRAFGCTELQLSVYPQNDAAVAFYQKCGFLIRCIDMQMKI